MIRIRLAAIPFLFLMISAIATQVSSIAYAQEQITMSTTQSEYSLGGKATVRGKVEPVLDNEAVNVSWTRPGETKLIDSISPAADGTFQDTLALSSKTNQGGIWTVSASYNHQTTSTKFVVKDPFFAVKTDHYSYQQGQSVSVSGSLSQYEVDQDKVQIAVYDSRNNVFSSKSVTIDKKYDFKFSFVLGESNTPAGKWFIDIVYGQDHRTALSFSVLQSPVSLSLGSAQSNFSPGDNVLITGNIDGYSALDDNKTKVSLKITDPDENTFATKYVSPNTNGSFAYNLKLTGQSAAAYGTWHVNAVFKNFKAVVDFTVKEFSPSITAKLSKESYSVYEPIQITGRVSRITGKPVALHIFNATGSLMKYAETPVSDSYLYSYRLNSSSQALATGNYSLLVAYANHDFRTPFSVRNATVGSFIEIETQKTIYATVDRIDLFGKIPKRYLEQNMKISIVVIDSNGTKVYDSNLVQVDSKNGTFTQEIKPKGSSWIPGVYIATATFGDGLSSSTFMIRQEADTTFIPTGFFSINGLRNTTISIAYDIPDGDTIDNVTVSHETNSISIIMTVQKSGKFAVNLPRTLINSLDSNGNDNIFTVSILHKNGNITPVLFSEKPGVSSLSRLLEMNLPRDTLGVVIAGTNIVPEFGTDGLTLTAAAVIPLTMWILASRRTDYFRS